MSKREEPATPYNEPLEPGEDFPLLPAGLPEPVDSAAPKKRKKKSKGGENKENEGEKENAPQPKDANPSMKALQKK